MTRDNVVRINNGRHPLQELVVPSFVPNGCDLLGGAGISSPAVCEQTRMLALTGPNHSGKSIYLKQVAIIVYLAHVGSFVPADEATIGITDKILTRISTRESVNRTESAFAIDLNQVAQAIRSSTRRSLILLDEFGKGTNQDDGAGLLAATLDHFLSLGSNAPRMLVATHFHEIFDGRYFNQNANLLLGHMDVRTNWEAIDADNRVTYLFKLSRGHSSSSFGGRCAALNGVPSTIVDRSEAISLLLSRNESIGSAFETLSRDEEYRLGVAEGVARQFLQVDIGRNRTEEGHMHYSTIRSVLCDIIPPQT